MSPPQGIRTSIASVFAGQEIGPFFLVLISCFLTAKFSQYLFYHFYTNPAVIWPTAGIALSAVALKGYRMWLPISLASFLSVLTSPINPPMLLIAAGTLGNTLQPLVGGYLLRRVGFDNSLRRVRDIFSLLAVSLFATILLPSINVSAQWLSGMVLDPTSSWWIIWSRTWAGGTLSILILTPLICTWFRNPSLSVERKDLLAILGSFGLLIATLFGLFWMPLLQPLVFVLLYVNFAALFWIALRLDIRSMTLALFLMTMLSMGGVVAVQTGPVPLNQRLLSIELFMVLIAPIFLMFSALIEERRTFEGMLEDKLTELRQAMRRLNIEDKSKNEFIAILAHELRNPLAPILSALEILKLKSNDPEVVGLVDTAQQQARSMRRMLEDLLDISRMTQKKFKLQKEMFQLEPAIRQCLQNTERFFKGRAQTLGISLPSEVVWVHADKVRFDQIIVNLLFNAGKYTKDGGRIELSCSISPEHLTLSVRDDGIGISSDELKYIFKPFRQVKPTPGVGTGLGIGLSLTKRLVEMHGGDIRAQSDGLGKGSTFTVTLPMQNTAQLPIALSPEPSPEVASPSAPLRILIVDDNEAAAHAMSRLLQYQGHQVSEVYNGQQALEVVSTLAPQVILLDIGLPDMDGYEVARRLRKSAVASRLVALTGFGQEEDKMRSRNAGFDHHLVKPVGIVELQSVLR